MILIIHTIINRLFQRATARGPLLTVEELVRAMPQHLTNATRSDTGGCPADEVIRTTVQSGSPLDSTLLRHLMVCASCHHRHRTHLAAHRVQRPRIRPAWGRFPTYAWWGGAALATFSLIPLWLHIATPKLPTNTIHSIIPDPVAVIRIPSKGHKEKPPEPPQHGNSIRHRDQVEIDLNAVAVMRNGAVKEPIHLPTAERLDVRLGLPDGRSDADGTYMISFLDQVDKPLFQNAATSQNEVLRFTVDSRMLATAKRLCLTTAGRPPLYYSVTID